MTGNAQDIPSEKKLRDFPITWLRKNLTIIIAHDIDHDGYPGYNDFMTIAQRLIKHGNVKGKAADDVIEFFRSYAKPPKDGARSEIMGKRSLGEFVTAAWKAEHNPGVIDLLRSKYSRMFKIFDLDSSGYITFDEYLVFWRVYDLDLRFAKMQFDYMDTDGDGKISEEEFVNAAVDYYTSLDADTPNRFYGPLINY
ncbi:unnamed protein product [Owenia fusiformis]|uniref:EF-hand domain-containing protein n=1 Tax=Owenia fusiformis TaxID=6347 RepID=A0A8S4PUT0_OWEFU|nr:unnamed protein product [Owenia fusiformis]